MIVCCLWLFADANYVVALRRGFVGTSGGYSGAGQHRLWRGVHGCEESRCRAGRTRAKEELKET